MNGKVITHIGQLPSRNLVVLHVGFTDFLQYGIQGLYHEQIQDLLSKGYDVLLLDLPGHTSLNELCFSNPRNYHQFVFERLEEIYEKNGQVPFKLLAFSSAAAVFAHCWALGASKYVSGICFVSPAFAFNKQLHTKLWSILCGYYLAFLLVLAAGLFNWPFLFLLPLLYFGMRNITVKKDRIRKEEVSPMLDVCPRYPLIASAQLLLMQKRTLAAIKKHALYPTRVLIFLGNSDPFFDYDYVRRLFKELRATVVELDDAGHCVLLTHWENMRLREAWNDFFS